MRILLAAGIYPPQIGGPATYAKLLAEELPKRGAEVIVVKFSDTARSPKLVRHFSYFARVLKKGKGADLIFAQDAVSAGLPALCAAVLLRKKFFVRVGGDYAWEQARGLFGIIENLDEFIHSPRRYPLRVLLFRSVQKFVAQKAKKVIVPSKYLAGIVEAWGIPREKIVTVYNTFSIPDISDARATLKRELKLQDHMIISSGRLVEWKGFETLIDIMPQIARSFVYAHLYIAGEGPERKTLERKIRNMELGERVTLLGSLAHDDLVQYVKAADVFVLNTAYEGLSHQILETMALGTPIVTTDIPGNRELLENKVTGTLVPHDDRTALSAAIREALSAGKEIDGMVARAKDKAATFTISRTAEDTLAALKS